MIKAIASLIILFVCVSFAYPLQIETEGGYTRDRLFPLRINNSSTRLLKVVCNGVPMLMKSYDSFRRISLSRGINTIIVMEYEDDSPETERWREQNRTRRTSSPAIDSVVIYADISPAPLKIIHTWDNEFNYVDLYVTEPSGETLSYGNRSSRLGGVMDIGMDTVGYGPQIYTMPYMNAGVYEIYISYWGGSRSRLTEITTTVIMHEGTEREERQVFQAFLTRPGHRIFVGKVELK
jgi:uncharacterized protein YfaP (DUF2135 family)